MKNFQRFLLTITLAAAMALPAYAYDADVTHRQMTSVATKKSVLYTDPSILFGLGFLAPDKQLFSYYQQWDGHRTGLKNYSLADFLAEGAEEEDYFPDQSRPLNHFFDPAYNRGLTVAGILLGYRSWEFMTEPNDIPGQDNSLKDARSYLTYALMYNDGDPAATQNQRVYAMTWVLRTLGHAMHHIQDMAQPQHVRNDQHLDKKIIGNPSRYEKYTAAQGDALLPLMEQATPIYTPDLKTESDFWFNSANSGIAQTVNQQFLSQGTNFQLSGTNAVTGAYAQPVPEGSTDYTVDQLFGPAGLTLSPKLQEACGKPALNCTITMYATALNERASTLSIFDQDLRATGVHAVFDLGSLGFKPVAYRFFDLNRFNFDDVYSWLMPRAVSYSAGLVNHFFRGKLQVSAPANGPYAVVDQSTGQGFRKVYTTVKNLTPGEALSSGSIRLIAKYHLNNCYKPDLSGEFHLEAGQVVTPCPNYRSAEEHISVSLDQAASFAADESKQLTFTMIDPIPLNATDLMFQVYYTGQVGAEASSFALGAVDVSEPTFMAAMNGTDTFALSGAFYYWPEIVKNIGMAPYSAIDLNRNGIYDPPQDVNVTGGDVSYEIYINNLKVADAPAVPQGRFTRLAMIVDLTGFDHTIIARGSLFTRTNSFHFPAKTLYWDFDRNQMMFQLVSPLRNDTLQSSATTLYAYYPAPLPDVSTMPKSLQADSTLPVPVQLTSAVILGGAPSRVSATSVQEPAAAPQQDGVQRTVTPTMPPAPMSVPAPHPAPNAVPATDVPPSRILHVE
jgi:hypothetical protein